MKYFFWLLFFHVAVFPQSQLNAGKKSFSELQSHKNNADDDLQSLENLGDNNAMAKKWESALPHYEKLKTLAPNNANYHYKYGAVSAMIASESNKLTALSMCGNIRSAFEKAIELNPKHIDARWALIEYYIQLPAIFGGSETKANSYADQLLNISPVDGNLAKGHIAEFMKKYELAEKHYLKANEIGQSPTTYQKLINLYKNKMDLPEKAKLLLDNSGLNPTPKIVYQQ